MFSRAFSIYRKSFAGLSKPVWLLSLVMFINRSGTMVLPFLTIYLTTQLGFSLEQAGWAMTCFGVGSLAGSFLGGKLTDKIGYYEVQFWTLFLGGILFMVLQFMKTPLQFYLMVLLMSTVVEAFRPASMTSLAAYSKPENRTRSFSLLRLAVNLGWSAGPAIGGWLAIKYGYFTLFYVDGFTCIAAALVFRAMLSPKKVEKMNKDEETEVIASAKSSPWQDKRYLFFIFLTILGAVAFMQFLSTLPVFYKQELSLTEAEIGLLMAYNGLLIFILEMPLVYMAEMRFNKLDCIIAGAILYGLSYVILNLGIMLPVMLAFISMTAVTFGEMLNMPFSNSYALNMAPPKQRGQYMGLFTMAFSLSHILAPAVGMQIAAHWGFAALWWFLSVVCAVAVVGMWYLKKIDKLSLSSSTN